MRTKENSKKKSDMSKKEHKSEKTESQNEIPELDKKQENQADVVSREEELSAQVAEMNDKFLRLYSEFDNYRKRTLKEKLELSKTASAEIITKLLPVLDDFERAIKAIEGDAEVNAALKDGIVLIFNKFFTILNQQGLEQMKTMGEVFNTDFHEAITNIPVSNPGLKNTIVDEIEKGYLLNEKVIRYAKVVVGN
jgi:molecular chaperone GrpE